MWYLVLPPIIIIVALAVLVYFFSKRFPRVEREIAAHLDSPEVKPTYGLRVFEKTKQVSLYVLERLAQWFKVMSLRIYNALHHWTQSLREKKLRASVKKSPAAVSTDVSKELDEKSVYGAVMQATTPPSQVSMPIQRVRPMVSRRVTKPEQKTKPLVVQAPAKNQLEDILVERIAANPRDLEAYERLGEYYMEQGNLQDAKECYKQVIRLSPVHRLAKIKIRRLEKLLEQK